MVEKRLSSAEVNLVIAILERFCCESNEKLIKIDNAV